MRCYRNQVNTTSAKRRQRLDKSSISKKEPQDDKEYSKWVVLFRINVTSCNTCVPAHLNVARVSRFIY